MTKHQMRRAAPCARRADNARREAFVGARQRAMNAGLDVDTADACAHRAMDLWDPEYAEREWHELIDEEVRRHAQP